MDVGVRQRLPERTVDVAVRILLHADLLVCRMRVAGVGGVPHDSKSIVRRPRRVVLRVVEFVGAGCTLRTGSIFAARNKALFWVIGDVGRENGMYTANRAISAHHLDALLPSLDYRLEEDGHSGMEKLLVVRAKLGLGSVDLGHFLDRQISYQDAGLLRGFATNTIRDVAKRQVDGVRLSSAGKLGKLRLVCRDDEQRNGAPRGQHILVEHEHVWAKETDLAYLYDPPPFTSPHLGIHARCFVLVGEHLLRLVLDVVGKSWVSPEGLNRLENVAVYEDEWLVGILWEEDVFRMPFTGATRYIVEPLVKSSCILVRKAKPLSYLCDKLGSGEDGQSKESTHPFDVEESIKRRMSYPILDHPSCDLPVKLGRERMIYVDIVEVRPPAAVHF